MKVLRDLEKIAYDNGGNRAHGTSGFNASVDYVLSRVKNSTDSSWISYIQRFWAEDWDEENTIAQNIIAETKQGNPNHVIMLGAHLDSVPAGPGINDNASGVSLLLALYDAMQGKNVTNKLRFAWWGAEETGLEGSGFYTEQINNTKEADNILCYINFDMVAKGSHGLLDGDSSDSNYTGLWEEVYEPEPGNDIIEKLFIDAFKTQGLQAVPNKYEYRSDYADFDRIHIPTTGLNLGREEEDLCYHKACDNLTNTDEKVLLANTKAAAQVLAKLESEGHKILPKRVKSPTKA